LVQVCQIAAIGMIYNGGLLLAYFVSMQQRRRVLVRVHRIWLFNDALLDLLAACVLFVKGMARPPW